MGWFSKDDHGAANNAGQADGAKDGKEGGSWNYTGTLFSGRSYEEQKTYNRAYETTKSTTKDSKS
jgi:hypothetical protein